MIIAHYAITLSEKKDFDNNKYTFGWQRAETLGALVNSVFLLALCFSIFLTSIERFFSPVDITQPTVVLIVGALGLLVNLIGMLLFHNAHHEVPVVTNVEEEEMIENQTQHESADIENQTGVQTQQEDGIREEPVKIEVHHHHSLNMRGAFLHVLGDALGSVGVILSAVVIKWSGWQYANYMDPAVSMLIAGIIALTTLRLFKKTSSILLHVVPPSISISKIRRDISNLSFVKDLHELHVWQLSDFKIIASVHVILKDETLENEYMEISEKIKKILHVHSIHNTTVQLERQQGDERTDDNPTGTGTETGQQISTTDCQLACTDTLCQSVTCCD